MGKNGRVNGFFMKPNIAKLVDINFLVDNEENRQAIGFAKMER